MRLSAIIILLIFYCSLSAQDRIYFIDGTAATGTLISADKKAIEFRLQDSVRSSIYKPAELVMISTGDGKRFIFCASQAGAAAIKTQPLKRNILGIQPIDVFFGRLTVVYERLNENGKIGFVIPVSMTFDPVGVIYKPQRDSLTNEIIRTKGIGFITGLDVNFYLTEEEDMKFFIGPRVRYGYDFLLGNVEALSVQTQLGWRFSQKQNALVQHLSFGFGFVYIIDTQPGNLMQKQAQPWISLNYRTSIRW